MADPRRFGVIPPDSLRAMTGMEFLQATLDGRLPQAPIRESARIWITGLREGWAEFRGCPDETQQNPFGTIQGGWYGVMLDSVMASAVISLQGRGVRVPTLEFKVNILRPILPGQEVVATAEVLHAGRSTAVAQGEIRGVADGRLLATGTTTCIVVPA